MLQRLNDYLPLPAPLPAVNLSPSLIENVVGVLGAGVVVLEGAALGAALLLWAICARTRWPAASAAFRLNSPARTVVAMMRASCLALSPGCVGCGPRTPRRSSIAAWGSRMVPPPMVPTSMEGMETEMCRLPPWLKNTIQLAFVLLLGIAIIDGWVVVGGLTFP
jgi:hypothetical protein